VAQNAGAARDVALVMFAYAEAISMVQGFLDELGCAAAVLAGAAGGVSTTIVPRINTANVFCGHHTDTV
jgi:hypothetical protein